MAIITLREAITSTMREEMTRDENVIIMGCDVALRGNPFGISKGLLKEFGPKRVIDTPISEASFTGLGIGAAIAGLRPLVEILYNDWITLPMDQIINIAAKISFMFGGQAKVPVVIRSPFGLGGGVAAQHSQNHEAWFIGVPGLKVCAPSTPYDVKGLLKTAIRDDNPVVFFEHKRCYQLKGEVPEEDYTIPFGKAAVKREGSDVTIVTYSHMAYVSEEAAKELEKEGISVEIVDLRTLLPIDYDTVVESIAKTGRVVVVHEACERGGVAGEVIAEICKRGFDLLDAPPLRVGSLNVPVPFARNLEPLCPPNKDRIIEAIRKVLE